MAENDTDMNGVVTDDETADPSQNIDAPDPLLHETARSGALSTPTVGTKSDAQSVATKARSNLENLQQQYGDVQKGLTGAYKGQTKALNDARDRLLNMNFGPTDQEAAYRRAAAFTQSKGEFNPGDVNTANADIMSQQRAGELQKQQLLANYGIQGAQAQIGQYGAMGNSLIQRMRIASGEEKSANTQVNKVENQAPKTIGATGMVYNPETQKYEFHADIAQAQEQQKAKNAQDAQAAKIAASKLSAADMDPATIDFAAEYFMTNKQMLPGFQARMTNGQVNPVTSMVYKKVLEKAAAAGDSTAQLLANQGMNVASQKIYQDFMNPNGATGKAINGLNTSIEHTQVLNPLIDHLDNTNVTAANYVKNWFATNFQGKSAPNDYNAVRDFVVGEISKAVLPGGGGEQERQQLAKTASSTNDPRVLKSVVADWYKLLAGKTVATRLQWDNGTLGRFGEFDRLLTPATKSALGIKAPTALAHPGQTPAPAAKTLDPLVLSYLPGGANYKPPQQ